MTGNVNLNNQAPISDYKSLSSVNHTNNEVKSTLPNATPSQALIEMNNEASQTNTVTVDEASSAVRNIAVSLGDNSHFSIMDIENLSMENVALLAANLGIKSFSDSAAAASKASQLMADTQIDLRDKQVKEFQQELTKRCEGHKGGIFGAIFDWVVSTVEVAIGLCKIIEGAARVAVGDVAGGTLDITSGSAYSFAGLCGLIKTGAEVAILAGADKEQCEKIINVFSKMQLGAEVVGMA